MIKLLYVTNQPDYAAAAIRAGVDRIFVDLEYMGKDERQKGMDTVKSRHTVEDVRAVRAVVHKPAELLVRINPLHKESLQEIDAVISAGADAVMLPMWTDAEQVASFVRMVNGRVRVIPLLETAGAATSLDEVLLIKGVDEIFIGLNDLHLSKEQPFIFCPLADGTVDMLCAKMRRVGMPFGFGGIATMEGGMLPGALVLGEHVRLGSQAVILSRSFCCTDLPLASFSRIMAEQIAHLRHRERYMEQHMTPEQAAANHTSVCTCVERIMTGMHGAEPRMPRLHTADVLDTEELA
ncbi:MAG: aldolase [Clostridia bacterium]|nr:aldolase [Clostridia bacterium]